MNKIFKVVWSKVKHCYVVVSEIAKNTISGGARRSRVRKGALAAALVTAFLSSSFAMPNSAWAAAYDMGTSYEALIVLSAKEVGEKVQFGIELWRGDVESAMKDAKAADSSLVYYNYNDKQNLPSQLKGISGYYYTKVSSVGANATFDAAIEQTVINQIISSVRNGENVSVTPVDSNQDGVTDEYAISAVDTKLKTNDSTKSDKANYEDYKGLALDNGNLVLAVKDTAGNVITGSANIGEYISQVAKNATYITNTDGTKVTIGDQISQNISNITNLTNTVNAGWIAKIDNTEIEITPATTEKPNANVLNFAATGAATVSLSGNTLTIGAVDTYTTGVKVNATTDKNDKIVINTTYEKNDNNTYPGISFVAGENIELSANETGTAITISSTATGTGSNYSWVVKDNHGNSKEITNDANKLSFVGTGAANVVLDAENNTLTVSAVDTNTTYEVQPVEAADLSGNQVNKWNVNKIDNQTSTLIATITDTDTRVLSGSVYEGDKGSYGINLVTNEKNENDENVVVPIGGLHDYYTTGVNVEGSSLKFNRNDGGSYNVNFTSGGGNREEGDTYVKVSASGGLITLPTGSKVTANYGQNYQENQVLEDITINDQKYTLGYSWKLGIEGDNNETTGDIVVNSGQTLKLAEGENVSLAYNNGTITISALVKAEGKYADWQQPATRGGTTNSTTGLPQLSKLTVDGKEYSIPTINEIDDPDSNAPLLKAVELNGKEYRIADPDWTVKVANKLARSEAFSTFTVSDGNDVEYVAGSNIVLSAEATSTGGKIIVATADNVGFNSVTVGGNDSGNVVINNSGIDMGDRNITGLAAGVADTDAVNVGQLRDVVQSSIAANDQHLVVNPDSQDGKYKVDGNTVTLKVQGKDANGGTVYTNVVIDDVASASSVNEQFGEVNNRITNIEGEVTTIKSSIENINQNIANAKVEVEAGSNITVEEDEMDGGGKKYTISATDTNTVNQHMKGTGWVDGSDGKATDDLLIKVNDSDGKSVEATIKDVAKASDLRKESDERKKDDATLAQAIDNNHRDVQNLNAGLNKLGNRMNKVGAGSAALAALHPMDFDPDDKLQFSAGVGHYGGENAAALGAFYRPTEKVMFSVAGTMGNGEDMVNAGVTFALDKPNNVSNSRVAMAREIQDLRQQVAALTMLVMQMASRDNAALAGVAMFPDVPENHWAYDYIEGLQKQGIIEGYPDGNFGGDRSMTRYEFAAMLYRALEKGFPVDSRLLNEFNAELGRIRVDRIKGADNDANKVERVRVNNYEDRDDYGSKIVQVKAGA